MHIESLEQLVNNNPSVQIVCNVGVGRHIEEAGYGYQNIPDGHEELVAGFTLRAFASQHAEIYEDVGQVEHTGYLVDGRLFLAGDSFTVPPFTVEILAPAVVAPFCTIKDTVDMVMTIQPKTVITMHDGQLNEAGHGTWYGLLERLVVDASIHVVRFPAGTTYATPAT